jgi:transposase
LASKYGVHAGQVIEWKKQLMEQVTELFTDGRKRRPDEATNEHELYEQIGRLKMEVEWLKKICRGRLRSSGDASSQITRA